MSGTVEKFNASTRTLSLSTGSGTTLFTLPPITRIREGWQRIEPADLEKLAGHRAVVHYSESSGIRTVEFVHVFGKANKE